MKATTSHTVGRVARRFGLSRSTLLYYDSIGVLRPSLRSSSNYRLYTQDDCRRLERICRYRRAGLSLAEIRRLLDGPAAGAAKILKQRLEALNDEIAGLREQQRVVVRLLRSPARLGRARAMDKQGWISVLRAAGLSDEDMGRWHVEFERMAPRAHLDFLESLGIRPAEIEEIRSWARRAAAEAGDARPAQNS